MALQHLQHKPQQAHLNVQLSVLFVKLFHRHQQHAFDSTGGQNVAASLVTTAMPYYWALTRVSLQEEQQCNPKRTAMSSTLLAALEDISFVKPSRCGKAFWKG